MSSSIDVVVMQPPPAATAPQAKPSMPKFETINKNCYLVGTTRPKRIPRDEVEVCGCAKAKGECQSCREACTGSCPPICVCLCLLTCQSRLLAALRP